MMTSERAEELIELLATLLHFIPKDEPGLYAGTERFCVELRHEVTRIRSTVPSTIIDAAQQEIARLTACLAKANAGFEEYERQFYLKSMECEDLAAQLAETRAIQQAG